MIVVSVQADGTIQLPAAVRERLGIQPGAQMALEESDEGGSLLLRVMPAEAQLIEEDGVWTIRTGYMRPQDKDIDWVDRVREERTAAVLGEQ